MRLTIGTTKRLHSAIGYVTPHEAEEMFYETLNAEKAGTKRSPETSSLKWIKQHLRIKQFYGTSENAVKTQIWIAVSVYVLVAIVKKRLDLDASLYTLLQILSVTLFEKMPIHQALAGDENRCNASQITNQLNLFDF